MPAAARSLTLTLLATTCLLIHAQPLGPAAAPALAAGLASAPSVAAFGGYASPYYSGAGQYIPGAAGAPRRALLAAPASAPAALTGAQIGAAEAAKYGSPYYPGAGATGAGGQFYKGPSGPPGRALLAAPAPEVAISGEQIGAAYAARYGGQYYRPGPNGSP
jgi:hypothetical protein